MLIAVAPFAAFFLRSENYVSPRARQVSLLTGEWSPYAEPIRKGQMTVSSVLRKNLTVSLKSFSKNGIGGHGGYDFRHPAFFDPFSLVLFPAGLARGPLVLFP